MTSINALYPRPVLLSSLQGAQLDAADKHGISPLLAAIWEGHTACVKFLVEKVGLGSFLIFDNPYIASKLNSLKYLVDKIVGKIVGKSEQ